MSSHFSSVNPTSLDEPRAEQCPVERTIHGFCLVDEYAWLKAENWQEVMRNPSRLDPAIRAYLEQAQCEAAHVPFPLEQRSQLRVPTRTGQRKARISFTSDKLCRSWFHQRCNKL